METFQKNSQMAGILYRDQHTRNREKVRKAVGEDALAKVVVELIKDSQELRRAILEVVWNCPNIVTQV